MTRKQTLILAGVAIVLGVLLFFQLRTWRQFDWRAFAAATRELSHRSSVLRLLIAVALVQIICWLRAVRWKLFLQPVRKTRVRDLLPAQYIGFTGLALLGRPGELIRPYLIAKQEGLTLSSQLAVWTVERIFDIGAFAVVLCIDVFAFSDGLPHSSALRRISLALLALLFILVLGAWLVQRLGSAASDWIEKHFARVSFGLSKAVGNNLRAFGEGLHTIAGVASFFQLAAVSLLIWYGIALVYLLVLQAYPQPALHNMHLPQAVLLVASSMVGSLIQLPAVGGGTQLAVISMLSSVEWFAVPNELGVSAGILLWLVTTMGVVPAGLALARGARLSFHRLSREIQEVAPKHAVNQTGRGV
jgi:hypothetical protein